jgi:hypothetical protein
MIKVVTWVLGVLALVASGTYVFVYIYRWEWNRALIMLGFFVATEIALSTALILRQLARRPAAPAGQDVAVIDRIRDSRPERAHFAWLETSTSQFNVFITLLVGGGALISGGAWLLDRIASRVGPTPQERMLVDRLSSIAFPAHGLVADEAELLAQEVPFRDDPQLRVLLGPHAEDG